MNEKINQNFNRTFNRRIRFFGWCIGESHRLCSSIYDRCVATRSSRLRQAKSEKRSGIFFRFFFNFGKTSGRGRTGGYFRVSQ